MHSFSASNRRKSSQRNKRSRGAGKLTIDTKCASLGKAVPAESRVQGLSFVSFEESRARKKAHAPVQKAPSRSNTEEQPPTEPNSKRSLPPPISPRQLNLGSAVLKDGPAISASRIQKSAQGSLTLPPLHSRIKGLRPSPLDLNKDISPSDRAITIGIALSPSTLSNYTKSPSPILPRSPIESRTIRDPVTGQEVATPRIVITPAKERFSPSEISHTTGYRPASSVYSRYTTGAPRSAQDGNTPPVPPLPLFVGAKSAKVYDSRVSATTVFEENIQPSTVSLEAPARSPDSSDNKRDIRQSRPLTAGLATPRRSKGWWNIITSPFSAKTPTFWRSPPLREDDAEPIMSDAASMGASDPHAGVIFTVRAPDDTELRSAPASGVDVPGKDELTRRIPKRSDTAPGAMDAESSVVNIYRIPSTGEAAAYYNPNRHFPSLVLQSRSPEKDDDLSGWSPSHSVFIPVREMRSPDEIGRSAFSPDTTMSLDEEPPARRLTSETAKDGGVQGTAPQDPKPKGVPVGSTMFSTPSEEELKSAGLSRAPPQRGFTQATMDSMMSPMSATPVVEDAHVATMMGPQSSRGEQREVEVEPAPAPTPSHYGLGFATLGAATISHREETREVKPEPPALPPPPQRPPHIRQDSHGLGISDGERELFPPPQMLSEKPRLGTDRFGQLTIHKGDSQGPTEPWYRRFFWFLAFAAAALVILLIVLMVIFIPQRHDDMSVQATWVNLTGFPALVTGVSTIIQPNKTESRDTCVEPSGMWSCAAPATGSNVAGLPDFRLEIRFRNGTLPSNETALANSKRSTSRFMKRDSNPWTSYLYTPSPSPPSEDDQIFLGRTTDNITAPYNGEQTPFYITLLDPTALAASQALHKRSDSPSNFSYPYPTPAASTSASETPASHKSANASTASPDSIPRPALQSNGKPVAQELYPLVTAQPLRLYNRGLESEHYGFYTYFSRTIYTANLTGPTSSNASVSFSSNVALENATAVCTFSQTRMRVQIWTRKSTIATLPPSSGNVDAVNSTANDMSPPGSFPYPVTISLDRHGGEAGEKGVFCYGLDAEGKVVDGEKVWVGEERGVGGSLVNAAEVPGGNGTSDGVEKRDDSDGAGIDGGSGGCGCTWQNWG
ncbi:hypothetical protein PRZ48_000793 [Zasmidium cellare]|uniref:Glycoprotease family protein n=1 Tax=Zasmidium cellare TaxID=395010 RepID=A0ABR0F0D9_ZASCE|nr:hypothetical protein PRZ48_000793 [Zasmidium cellare]